MPLAEYDITDRVCVVTLRRPQARNAINADLANELFALHIELVNRLVPAGAVAASAFQLAMQITQWSQRSLLIDRAAVVRQQTLPLQSAFRAELAAGGSSALSRTAEA